MNYFSYELFVYSVIYGNYSPFIEKSSLSLLNFSIYALGRGSGVYHLELIALPDKRGGGFQTFKWTGEMDDFIVHDLKNTFF